MENIRDRKKNHLTIALEEESAFAEKSSGFENYDFLHYAASELTVADISLDMNFLGKKISSPFLIASMTGGFEDAVKINSILSEAAEALSIPIGVGSQRAMLEDEALTSTFKIVRQNAKHVPVIANIGAAEFVKLENFSPLLKIIDSVEADAIYLHLNLLQEMIQPEGEPNFKGLLSKVEKFTMNVETPLFVKEVGFGISKEVAEKFLNAGVQGIDVAGAGGTSWSKIEQIRKNEEFNSFSEWGLPTSYCVRTVAELKDKFNFVLIASGGINDSFAYAKSLALGADVASSARKILDVALKKGTAGVVEFVNNWDSDLKKIMVLTNSKRKEDLRKKIILKKEMF